MIQAALEARHYTSDAIFQLERTNLFSKYWVFFGLKHLLAKPNAFQCREIGGEPVLVQNLGGELKAFRNVCLHRHAPLQTAERGVRPLLCGYHGWRYADDGSVKSIPGEARNYKFDAESRCKLRLHEYALRCVGNLVFINLAAEPIPMEQQFSAPFLADLASLSEAFDDEVIFCRWRVKHNWKLVYENLKDPLHPIYLHPASLTTAVDFSESFPEPTPLPSDKHLNAVLKLKDILPDLSYGGPEGAFKSTQRPYFAEQVARWGTKDAYYNWLPFPNTHIVSANGGYSFAIEHHHPIAPDETEVWMWHMTAKRTQPIFGAASALWGYVKGAKVVLDEDHIMMEHVQRSLLTQPPRANFGAYESHLYLQQRWLIENVYRESER